MLHQRRSDINEKNESSKPTPPTLSSSPSKISSDPHNDDNDSYYTSDDDDSERQMLMAVPSIENVVMGGGDTVVDEEHYVPIKKKSSFGDLLILTETSTKQTLGFLSSLEGAISRWYYNRSLQQRIILLTGLYTLIMIIAIHVGDNRLALRSSTPPGTPFYGPTSRPDHNALLREPPTREEVVLMSFPGAPPPVSGVAFPNKAMARNLAHIYDPPTARDVPLLWHIPRSGGGSVKDVMALCLGMVSASDVGGRMGGGGLEDILKHKTLEVISLPAGRYVNVDTSTYEGLRRAKFLKLIPSQLPEAVVSILPPKDLASLFDGQNQARLFTMMRHPVERTISDFYYRGWAHWDSATYDPTLSQMSIESYAKEPRREHNWMVRFLSGRMQGEVTMGDLNVAKFVLSQKCLVGLLEQKEESMRRFEKYLHLNVNTPKKRHCVDKLMMDTWSNRHDHPMVGGESEVWKLLTVRNRFDIELYEYAKRLFVEQGHMFDSN